MSLDPLASEFPGKSPFGFVSNNPINRIDPDGKADYLTQSGSVTSDGVDDGLKFVTPENTISENTTVDFTKEKTLYGIFVGFETTTNGKVSKLIQNL